MKKSPEEVVRQAICSIEEYLNAEWDSREGWEAIAAELRGILPALNKERAFLASRAMSGLLANSDRHLPHEVVVEVSVKLADMLIQALAEPTVQN